MRKPILLRLRRARACGSELSIQVDQRHRRRGPNARLGKVSLKGEKGEELGSLEAPDDEGERCWPRRNRITRWRRRDPTPAFHSLAEDEDEQASGGLNHRVSRNAGGAQWTWKEVTVVVDSGAAENVMPRSMFSEISKETQRSMNGKGFKGRGGEHIKNNGQQVMSVRTPGGFCTQEHVAGCRREKTSSVSIPHRPSRERAVHWEVRGVHHEQEEEGEIGAQKGEECVRA